MGDGKMTKISISWKFQSLTLISYPAANRASLISSIRSKDRVSTSRSHPRPKDGEVSSDPSVLNGKDVSSRLCHETQKSGEGAGSVLDAGRKTHGSPVFQSPLPYDPLQEGRIKVPPADHQNDLVTLRFWR
jgi:hypothetical protein